MLRDINEKYNIISNHCDQLGSEMSPTLATHSSIQGLSIQIEIDSGNYSKYSMYVYAYQEGHQLP